MYVIDKRGPLEQLVVNADEVKDRKDNPRIWFEYQNGYEYLKANGFNKKVAVKAQSFSTHTESERTPAARCKRLRGEHDRTAPQPTAPTPTPARPQQKTPRRVEIQEQGEEMEAYMKRMTLKKHSMNHRQTAKQEEERNS